HPAPPDPAVADPRRPQEPRRDRRLSKRWSVRARERLRALQHLREGERLAGGGHGSLALGLPLSRRLARLGADSASGRPRGFDLALRRDRSQRRRPDAAHEPQPRLALAPLRAPAPLGPRVRNLLLAEPLQQLHLLPQRSRPRRRDQPARSSRARRCRHNVKANVILRPWSQTELFANFGTGFHSNDARAVILDPKLPALPTARGWELGVKTKVLPRVELSATYWVLDLASELVFIGDDGTTQARGPSHREGWEFATRVKLLEGLT